MTLKGHYVYVFICSGLDTILNAKYLSAAITHVRRITVLYLSVDCRVLYSIATITCMGLLTLV